MRDHEVSVEAEHAHKACAKKSEQTEVTVECDVILNLPDIIRHCVFGETKEAALSAAREWALSFTQWGDSYRVVYIGSVADA